MQVLIIDGTSQDRDLAARYLQPAGHEVACVPDLKGAMAMVDRKIPDVVVLDWALSGSAAFLQRLRRSEASTRPYVLAVSSRPNAADLTAAVAAGADDFMRKPLVRDELVIRVGALDRIRAWAAKVFGGGASIDLSSTDISRLQAWLAADISISKDIGELIGQPITTTTGVDAGASDNVLGAHIPLTLPAEQTEVRLTVGVDASSLAQLGALILGDAAAPEDALRDVLREFANTAGGGFVRAAAREGVSLTCGLPCDVTAGALNHCKSTAQRRFTVTAADGSFRVTFELEVLAKALRRVNVGQLVEGMVLARDLHTDAGALLVPAGTRLTSSQIERMTRVVSARVTFDVAEAA